MLEAGVPRFPQDFPTTEPYRKYTEAWEASENYRWERTPPAKRINYERLGIENPWKADWGNVLRRCTMGIVGHVSTQREAFHPWLLSRHLASSVLDGAAEVSNPADWLYDKLNVSRIGRGNAGLRPEENANDIWRDALIQVQVELHGRGTLGDVAAIYVLRDDEIQIYGSSFERLREVRFAYQFVEVVSENVRSPLNFNSLLKTRSWVTSLQEPIRFREDGPMV